MKLLGATLLASGTILSFACTTKTIVQEVPPDPAADASAGPEETIVEGPKGTVFGGEASSYAKTDAAGKVTAVGLRVAMAGLSAGPANHPFQDDLVLSMPDVAVEQTMAGHMRLNWLGRGHSPTPYGMAHWDLHFMQGTPADTDLVDCRSSPEPSADVIPPGYGQPELCVPGTGDHSWPLADKQPGAKFSVSIIMGFWQNKLNMIEPMITQATLEKKVDFEVDIAQPKKTGFGALLYPTHFTGHWDEETETWVFELDRFVNLEEQQ